jgi:hypothetical protein
MVYDCDNVFIETDISLLQGCSMGQVKVWSALVVGFVMGVANSAVAVPEPLEETAVTIHTAKLGHIVSERFLSLTIDPVRLMFGKEFG